MNYRSIELALTNIIERKHKDHREEHWNHILNELNNLFIEYKVAINRGTELSELKPEKKVLKNALTKLKANAITARETYNIQIIRVNEFLNTILKGVQNIPKPSERDTQRIDAVIMLLASIGQQVEQLVRSSLETINDWKTYTEVLEDYSAELDNTLTKIFEIAENISKEQIEKQKELIGKTPEYSR